MTEKEIKFISLFRSLDEEKLDRFLQILEMIVAEDHNEKASTKE